MQALEDSAAEGPTRPEIVCFLAGALGTLVGIVAAQLTGGGWARFFDNVHWTSSYLTAAVVTALAARRARGETRQARRAFALGLGAYAIGQILWDLQVWLDWNPFPGPSDLFFLMLGPSLALGLLIQARRLARIDRLALTLDTVGIGVAILALTLVLYLPRRGDTDAFSTLVLIAYPVLLLSASVTAALLVLARPLRLTGPVATFIIALTANGGLWMEWNARTLAGDLRDAVLFNYCFSIVALAQGLAAACWRAEPAASPRQIRLSGLVLRLIPLVLIIGAVIALMLSDKAPPRVREIVVAGAVVVVVVAAARQSLLLRDLDLRLAAEARAHQLEARLEQAQRLEALGTLSRGIAHDFNNFLMIITAGLALLRKAEGVTPRMEAIIDNVERGCRRGKEVTQRILAFARQGTASRQPLQLRDLVRDCLELVRPSLPARIELQADLAAEIPLVDAESGQMNQLVLNLVTNAVQAIGADTGCIDVRLQPVGDHVDLIVRDSGCGMDAATRRRIFEPFFTTKSLEQGTGLGLSVVHGIVQMHQGDIEVTSQPGCGATFRVSLPAAVSEAPPMPRADQQPAPATRVGASASAAGRSARAGAAAGALHDQELLIVDDEPAIGEALTMLIEQLGWRASYERSPRRARELVASRPQRFALLIIDRTMPDIPGDILARELRARFPRLKLVMSTGDAQLPADHALFDGYLLKPYDSAALERTLTRVLANRNAGATPVDLDHV